MQKLSGIIKEYHSDHCLNYAKVQETLGTIYLMTANLPQAKTHFKRAFKIYEKIWADEPEIIEAKYQEIQELYPQVGFFLGQQLSDFLTKQTWGCKKNSPNRKIAQTVCGLSDFLV